LERLDFRFTLQKRYRHKVVPYFDIGFPLLIKNRIKLQADGKTKDDRSFPGWRASSGRKALNKLTKERVVSLASTKIQVNTITSSKSVSKTNKNLKLGAALILKDFSRSNQHVLIYNTSHSGGGHHARQGNDLPS
jgi:hypothetical protein